MSLINIVSRPYQRYFAYLVPHGVTRWRFPVEADASGSSCYSLRVFWGEEVTTR